MRLHEIMRVLGEEPMLILPASHGSLTRLLEMHANFEAAAFQAKREGVDMCGGEVELDQMEVIDGIAHIPIAGPIGRGLGKFEKGAGAVDCHDIQDDINAAEADPHVTAILLDIDSPGGMFSGTPELADRISACDKPIFAFTAGMMCSAAYWLGCACDLVCATKSADVGSIGVYCALLDYSKRYEAAGVKVDVISSGKYKGAGVPGTSLSEAQRAQLQERIDDMAMMFSAHVMQNRPDSSLEDMQGQSFKADGAAARGLIDLVVRDKSEVVDLLAAR